MEHFELGSKVKQIKTGVNRIEEERQLEQQSLINGRSRFHKEITNSRQKYINGKQKEPTESTTIYGQQLLQKYIQPLNELIDRFFSLSFDKGRATKYADTAQLLAQCIPIKEIENKDNKKWSAISLIALKTVLDTITTKCTQTKSSVKIGNSLEDEARLLYFKENASKTFSKTKFWLKSKNNYRYKKRVYVYAMNKHKLEFGNWSKVQKVKLGLNLIYFIIEATGLVKLQKHVEGKLNTPVYVEPTEATMIWIKGKVAHSEALKPMRMPMLVKPREWTTPYNGGYLTHSFKIKEKNNAL